ncbi:MAG: hypothetical protein V4678_04550 [Patescibacteria group bacterium]
MAGAKSKYLVGIIIAIIVVISAAVATFFYMQSNATTGLTGTVKYMSCINQGVPCEENYVVLDSGESCGIGPNYKQYIDKKVTIEGTKTVSNLMAEGPGPKVCTIEVTSMRAI